MICSHACAMTWHTAQCAKARRQRAHSFHSGQISAMHTFAGLGFAPFFAVPSDDTTALRSPSFSDASCIATRAAACAALRAAATSALVIATAVPSAAVVAEGTVAGPPPPLLPPLLVERG